MKGSRAEIFVEGRVQGVAYRAFTKQVADSLGLSGSCENLPDGRVFVDVEGEREVIEQLVKELWVGPEAARVTHVQVAWGSSNGEKQSFSILI